MAAELISWSTPAPGRAAETPSPPGLRDRDGAKPVLLQAYLVSWVRFFFADTAFAGRLLDWAHTILRTTANAAITDAIAERTRSSHGT